MALLLLEHLTGAMRSPDDGVNADLAAAAAMWLALRVKGQTLHDIAAAGVTTRRLLAVHNSAANGRVIKIAISARRGADATSVRIQQQSNGSQNVWPAPDVLLADIDPDAFYTIFTHRDGAPPSGVARVRVALIADDGTLLTHYTNNTAGGLNLTTAPSAGIVTLGADPDLSPRIGGIYDGFAIGFAGRAVADIPLATPPDPEDADLFDVWHFGEGSGDTITGENGLLTLTRASAEGTVEWEAGGTWGENVEPDLIQFVTDVTGIEPEVGTNINVRARAVDSLSSSTPILAVDFSSEGDAVLKYATAPDGVDLDAVLATAKFVNGYADFVVPIKHYEEGETFALLVEFTPAGADPTLTVPSASGAFTTKLPAGTGGGPTITLLFAGDEPMLPMSAAGSAKERTLYFWAFDANNQPVVSLSGKAALTINAEDEVDSINDIFPAGAGGRYGVILEASELAATDDDILVAPFGTAAKIYGGHARVFEYAPAVAPPTSQDVAATVAAQEDIAAALATIDEHLDQPVSAAGLADGAITAAKLADGALTAAKFAAGALAEAVFSSRIQKFWRAALNKRALTGTGASRTLQVFAEDGVTVADEYTVAVNATPAVSSVTPVV